MKKSDKNCSGSKGSLALFSSFLPSFSQGRQGTFLSLVPISMQLKTSFSFGELRISCWVVSFGPCTDFDLDLLLAARTNGFTTNDHENHELQNGVLSSLGYSLAIWIQFGCRNYTCCAQGWGSFFQNVTPLPLLVLTDIHIYWQTVLGTRK